MKLKSIPLTLFKEALINKDIKCINQICRHELIKFNFNQESLSYQRSLGFDKLLDKGIFNYVRNILSVYNKALLMEMYEEIDKLSIEEIESFKLKYKKDNVNYLFSLISPKSYFYISDSDILSNDVVQDHLIILNKILSTRNNFILLLNYFNYYFNNKSIEYFIFNDKAPFVCNYYKKIIIKYFIDNVSSSFKSDFKSFLENRFLKEEEERKKIEISDYKKKICRR